MPKNNKILAMNKILRVLLLTTFFGFLLPACFQSSSNQDGYEVSLSQDELKYVPTTTNQIDDRSYMNEIDMLIDEVATAVYDNPDFINIIKAIAWTESKWEHYFEKNGKYYVFLGDKGHSFGIMQIYDTYHGTHYVLQDNLEVGAAFAYEKYQTARSMNCASGSNSGTDLVAIARRTYAQYNGGDSAICRDNDQRDNNLEDALSNHVWLNYL